MDIITHSYHENLVINSKAVHWKRFMSGLDMFHLCLHPTPGRGVPLGGGKKPELFSGMLGQRTVVPRAAAFTIPSLSLLKEFHCQLLSMRW